METAERQEVPGNDLKARWSAMVEQYGTSDEQIAALVGIKDSAIIELALNSRNTIDFLSRLQLTDTDFFPGRDFSDLESPYNHIVEMLTARARNGRVRAASVFDDERGNEMCGGGAE